MGVIVFGSINMDLTAYVPRLPVPGETLFGRSFITVPGGKGANQAVATARLGAPTRLVGRVGDDAFGPEVLARLAAEGVDVSGVVVDPEQGTGLAVINVDDQAENTIVVISGANYALDNSDVERCVAALPGAKVLLLQNEVPPTASLEAARMAKAQGITVIYDPAPAEVDIPGELLALADILTPNEVETEALVGLRPATRSEAQEAADKLRARGATAAIIKLGAQGVFYASPTGVEFVKPFPVTAVDSVAAGDAFNGGLATALAAGHGLAEAVRWGAAAGALAVTREGAMPSMPHRKEVERLLKEG